MDKKYKRMIEKFHEKESVQPASAKEKWVVYILECGDGTLYTGITNDIERRFLQHSTGKGARYTRTRLPLKIRYTEICESRSTALIRECEIKALPKPKKKILLERL